MIRRPPRSTQSRSSAASDVYKRQLEDLFESQELKNRQVDAGMEAQSALVRADGAVEPVSYTHLRAHETVLDLVCRLLLEKKKK